ncbi:MAG: zinc ABC transporter substrate-binding protein [Bacteroidota bacterium]|nr:zinc ABC transporter substrate-binding protein [Bacteroidota bacterium]
MKKLFAALLAVFLAFSIAHVSAAAQKKLNVVVTLNYLKYVTEQVGGDKVTVTALANPKQDPHYVTPTPRMNEVTTNADLFIENGLSLDLWAKNVIDASGNPNIGVGNPGHLIATINVPVRELPTEVSRAWGDIHPQGNPHIWLDPLNVRIVAENIAARLQQIDPTNSGYYQQRLDAFKHRLDEKMYGSELLDLLGKKGGDILTRKTKDGELYSWLASRHLDAKLGGWMKMAEPLQGKEIISYHKTYIYFADRFGVKIAGELEEKPGIPPPAKHRDEVVDLVKRDGVKVILNDNFYSTDAADYVASKTGAKVIVTYIDVYSSPEANTYENLITYLLEKILKAAS